MSQKAESNPTAPDPQEVAKTLANIAQRSQNLVQDFLTRHMANAQPDSAAQLSLDPLNIGSAFFEMTSRMMSEPQKLIEAQINLWNSYMDLWARTTRRMLGEKTDPVIEPDKGDRRFKDESWSENAVFDYIKQSYLLSARYLQHVVDDVEGMNPRTRQKVDFYTRQFIDALSPSNFALTNPTVLKATVESGGENLIKGLENLLEDLEKGDGTLRISMTDETAFEVGKNVATTPGKVVYQNDLMQLIQYEPTTDEVHKTPLLIIPPWINKFYILDLRAKNSFIKWAVDQGHTVFVISWVNPDAKLAEMNFEDYMKLGPLDARTQIEKLTGEREVNVIGYCLGGTLLATTLAYLAAKGEGDVFKTATYFTTLLDFEEAGELTVFIDEEQLAALEQKMNRSGYLDGKEMATTFNMLRANDLIWSFVVNNYLLGKDPFPFDLLYWNGDSTRMPAKMHSFYLRNMYLENKLVRPGAIEIDGTPIDLTKIETPSFLLSTREDHIAPWVATYRATQIFKGPTQFVLSASGHIAGVVNPPAAEKYCFWTNRSLPEKPEDFLATAEEHAGSWWPTWEEWVEKRTGEKVPARKIKKGLEAAPGSYVKVRAVG